MVATAQKGIRRELAQKQTAEVINSIADRFGIERPVLPPFVGKEVIDLTLAMAERELEIVQFFSKVFEKLDNQGGKDEDQKEQKQRTKK